MQAKISTIEAQLKVVEEGPTDKEIEARSTSAEARKPSALENTPVSPKYKAQVLAFCQILKHKREWDYPVEVSTVEGRKYLVPNKYLIAKIGSFIDASVDASHIIEYCTKLDIRANMVVLGRNCLVFDGIYPFSVTKK